MRAPELTWIRTRCESGNCVEVAEVGAQRCDTGSCVEAAAVGTGTVAIRSSEMPLDKLRITRAEWLAFVAGVKAGDFDSV
jgi:hypothetical protein